MGLGLVIVGALGLIPQHHNDIKNTLKILLEYFIGLSEELLVIGMR